MTSLMARVLKCHLQPVNQQGTPPGKSRMLTRLNQSQEKPLETLLDVVEE